MPKGYKKNGSLSGKVFEKGHTPENPFKKEHIPWNKGISIKFNDALSKWKKDGGQSWNKGKHPEYMQGKNNPNWKGGIVTQDGYVHIFIPTHPYKSKNNYVRRSRLVMEKHLGRYLTREEIVHHRGIKYSIKSIRNKQDDRIENLRLFSNKSKHTQFHQNLHKL